MYYIRCFSGLLQLWCLMFVVTLSFTSMDSFGEASKTYYPTGGSEYFTSHSTLEPVPRKAHYNEGFQDEDIKEFHFHVYFFQNNPHSVADSERLRKSIVEKVSNGEFIAVCDGVNSDNLPGFNSTEKVPPVNMEPRGPHPAGSYEVWVPQEYLGKVMSHIMLNRGENSVMLHSLTKHCIEDHTGRLMWMGVPFNIDRTVLLFDDPDCDPPQYPELGLGYSA